MDLLDKSFNLVDSRMSDQCDAEEEDGGEGKDE